MTRRPLALAASAAVAATGLAVLAAPGLGARGDLELVSRADGPAGLPGSADSGLLASAISADGRYVAFESDGNNLSAEDDNGVTNIFVRDLLSGTTVLVSRATGPSGAGADESSEAPSISADGRHVAFESDASNLSAEDDDPDGDIFVRDLVAGTTTWVSRLDGSAGGEPLFSSFRASISGDGRFVAFDSAAANLSAEDTDVTQDVFVRDLIAGTTVLVSRATGPAGAGADGNSAEASISADGTRVAFRSDADNLSGDDAPGTTDVFVRDLAAGTTTLVSRATGAAGAGGDDDSVEAAISRSGRYVAFSSVADNLSAEDDDALDLSQVHLRDLDAATTVLVSRADGAGGAAGLGDSGSGRVSDDGRVAFASEAPNLSAEDGDAVGDVFARDTGAGTTELVSRGPGPAGAPADASSSAPAVSADGRHVAFSSDAGNLLAGTTPGVRNVYRRDVLGDPPAGGGAGAPGAPAAAPVCKVVPPPSAPPATGTASFTLSASQLLINQRIGQAAIRRLNAVESRLAGGLSARDLCGHSVGADRLGTGIVTSPAAVSLAAAAPADPAPIQDPGRSGPGGTVTLSAAQLLINQRIYQAAIRRADGIARRLGAGLSGGDIDAGAVTQGKLVDRLQVVSAIPAAEAAATVTVTPPRARPPDPGAVVLSVGQLRINQRIAQAGVRDANALIRRLETGLTGADLRPGTLTAADLG
ncbi:MAG: hypothetical protein AB7V62_00485 [Thermoleophilia bacterium]